MRKGDLVGDKHLVTGLTYDAEGFPIFESKGEKLLKETDLKKSRNCSKALYEKIIENPERKQYIQFAQHLQTCLIVYMNLMMKNKG